MSSTSDKKTKPAPSTGGSKYASLSTPTALSHQQTSSKVDPKVAQLKLKQQLASKKVSELKTELKSAGVKGLGNARKEQLVSALAQHKQQQQQSTTVNTKDGKKYGGPARSGLSFLGGAVLGAGAALALTSPSYYSSPAYRRSADCVEYDALGNSYVTPCYGSTYLPALVTAGYYPAGRYGSYYHGGGYWYPSGYSRYSTGYSSRPYRGYTGGYSGGYRSSRYSGGSRYGGSGRSSGGGSRRSRRYSR